MRLLAISDLHIDHETNRLALAALPPCPEDWLILGGDISESVADLEIALDLVVPKFARVFWTPGNHELWTVPRTAERERGEARYARLVAACRVRGVLTPEDGYLEWPLDRTIRIAPIFVLYDYSFAPEGIEGRNAAIQWAADDGIAAADEALLHCDPHEDVIAWSRARIALTEPRLTEASRSHRLVLVGHWPLRRDVVRLGKVPRYVPWCGTRATEDWHVRFNATCVVHGHLHVRATDVRDGVRFEEVSLGYPRDWQRSLGVAHYLRRIL